MQIHYRYIYGRQWNQGTYDYYKAIIFLFTSYYAQLNATKTYNTVMDEAPQTEN